MSHGRQPEIESVFPFCIVLMPSRFAAFVTSRQRVDASYRRQGLNLLCRRSSAATDLCHANKGICMGNQGVRMREGPLVFVR